MFKPLMLTGENVATRSTPNVAFVPSTVAVPAPVVWIVVAALMSIVGLAGPKVMTRPLVTFMVDPGFALAVCTARRKVQVGLPTAQLFPTVVSAPSVTVYVEAASAARGSGAPRNTEMPSAAAT